MTERRPPGMGFETWVDKQIREATERGEFDNLPGTGKPIPGQGQPDDELWWVRGYLRREGLPTDALLPTPLQLRNEVERLGETVRDLPTEADVRDTVRQLNLRIAQWLRTPSGPNVHIAPVGVDDVVEQWRARRQQPAAGPAEAAPARRRRRVTARPWRRAGRPRGG